MLADGENVIEFYDYRAFRYIEILDAPSEPEVWVDVRHHPFDTQAARFSSSDELLDRIWELCKAGVRYGSQGGFLDCPSREKGQYLGDALLTGHSHLLLTGDVLEIRDPLLLELRDVELAALDALVLGVHVALGLLLGGRGGLIALGRLVGGGGLVLASGSRHDMLP